MNGLHSAVADKEIPGKRVNPSHGHGHPLRKPSNRQAVRGRGQRDGGAYAVPIAVRQYIR